MRMFNLSSYLAVIAIFAVNADSQDVIFFDDFSDETSLESWDIVEPQYLGLDPEAAGYEADLDHFWLFVNYTNLGIPPSPYAEESDSTLGLQIYVNIGSYSAPFNTDAVNFYTKESFSGNIRVSADVWLNYVPGTSGTTEHFGLGLYQSGDYLLNFRQVFGIDHLGVGGDGYFFMMDSDGDSGSTSADYLFTRFIPNEFIMDASACGEWQFLGVDEGFEELAPDPFHCRQSVQSGNREAADRLWKELFPADPPADLATPGNRWVNVVMEYIDGTITVLLNGTPVHIYTDEDRMYTSGRAMFSWEDIFPSNGEDRSWLLIDRFWVEQLEDTPVSEWTVH